MCEIVDSKSAFSTSAYSEFRSFSFSVRKTKMWIERSFFLCLQMHAFLTQFFRDFQFFYFFFALDIIKRKLYSVSVEKHMHKLNVKHIWTSKKIWIKYLSHTFMLSALCHIINKWMYATHYINLWYSLMWTLQKLFFFSAVCLLN